MKKNNVKKKIIATFLAGTMLFSLAGCKDVYEPEAIETDDFINSKDENGNDLCVLALYDTIRNDEIKYEFYGYFRKDGDNLSFYDVLNKQTLNLSGEEFNNYKLYSMNFDAFLREFEYDTANLNYAIYKGIKEEDLLYWNKAIEVEGTDEKLLLEEDFGIIDNIDNCYINLFDLQEYFDDEKTENLEESTTLVKN